MIIRIDKNKKVISCIYKPTENFKADGVRTFEVESVPERKANTLLYFDIETKKFYTQEIDKNIINQSKLKAEAQKKKTNALKWLSENDWKCNKIIRGEWTTNDPRWLNYLDGARKARAAQDEADEILKKYK